MTRYFTSDYHFGHKKLADLRGYNSIWEHDEGIIEQHNKVVDRHDIVYILGDFALCNWDYALVLAGRLNGQLNLISGNHDATWPYHKGWRGKVRESMRVFHSVSLWDSINLGEYKVMLSHLPAATDTPDDRYRSARLAVEGPLLCGHVHSKWAIQDKMINVGYDIWHEPLSEDYCYNLIQGVMGHGDIDLSNDVRLSNVSI